MIEEFAAFPHRVRYPPLPPPRTRALNNAFGSPLVFVLIDLLGQGFQGQTHGVQVVLVAVTIVRRRQHLSVILRENIK